jgi:hypothetical protein
MNWETKEGIRFSERIIGDVQPGRNAHRDEFSLIRKMEESAVDRCQGLFMHNRNDQVELGLRCEMNPHLMGDVYVLTFREDCSRLFSELSALQASRYLACLRK